MPSNYNDIFNFAEYNSKLPEHVYTEIWNSISSKHSPQPGDIGRYDVKTYKFKKEDAIIAVKKRVQGSPVEIKVKDMTGEIYIIIFRLKGTPRLGGSFTVYVEGKTHSFAISPGV